MPEESRDITEFIAQKRNVNNYKHKSNDKLLSAIKEKSKILTPEKPLKPTKQKNNQILTPENNQSQKTISNDKERIGIIREELKELAYKLSKSELKEIKKRLYEIENKKDSLGSKKSRRYLDELDEKIRKLDKYYHDDDFEYRGIKNVQDLFKLSVDKDYYQPKFVKSGYNNNYIRHESKGDKILTVKEYLALIEQYLADLINDYKSKDEWKIQLTAEINFISLKPDSNETRIMHTKSDNEEIVVGSDTSDVIKELFKSLLQR